MTRIKIALPIMFAILLGSLSACSAPALSDDSPGAVLAAYGKTRAAAAGDRFIHLTDLSKIEGSALESPLYCHDENELSVQNERIKIAERSSGLTSIPSTQPLKASTASQVSLWDGKNWYEFVDASTVRESCIFIGMSKRDSDEYYSIGYAGAVLEGIIPGDLFSFDQVLVAAPGIRIRGREKIGGHDCIVLQARTKRGDYTVWFDPARGYNVLKARVTRQGDDGYYQDTVSTPRPDAPARDEQGKLRPEVTLTRVALLIDQITLQRVNGIWVPSSCHFTISKDYKGGRTELETTSLSRGLIDLSPKFSDPKTFQPQVPNGADVFIVGNPGGPELVWRDGQVVPAPPR